MKNIEHSLKLVNIKRFISISIISLGLLVMIGWHFNMPFIIQINDKFVPMQYNTALGFVLSGLALYFTSVKKIKYSSCIGLLIVLLGFITLLEIIFNLNLYIDQLFIQHYITVHTETAGRMAPSTATAFLLIGVSFVLDCYGNIYQRYAGILASVVLGISMMAFMGYVIGIPTAYGWHDYTRMALHTAIGFVFLSVGIILHIWNSNPNNKHRWISSSVATGILISTIGLSQAIDASQSIENIHNASILVLIIGTTFAVTLYFAIERTFKVHLISENLSIQKHQLDLVLKGSNLGFWDWNMITNEVERNELWATMLGYTYDEIKCTTHQWTYFIHPEDREKAWNSIYEVLDGKKDHHKCEYRMLHKDGSVRWILDQANITQRDINGCPIRMCGTHVDITEQKLLQLEVEYQAHYDFLTGVFNRRYFMEKSIDELKRSLQNKIALCVLMMDIDHFKKVNDTYGHDIGDDVLKKVAKSCSETLRKHDIFGRLGGEEFAVILSETTLTQAFEIAERLRYIIQSLEIKVPNNPSFQVTVSIGISCISLDFHETSIDYLLHVADNGLYLAKNSGRNRICIDKQALEIDEYHI